MVASRETKNIELKNGIFNSKPFFKIIPEREALIRDPVRTIISFLN